MALNCVVLILHIVEQVEESEIFVLAGNLHVQCHKTHVSELRVVEEVCDLVPRFSSPCVAAILQYQQHSCMERTTVQFMICCDS